MSKRRREKRDLSLTSKTDQHLGSAKKMKVSLRSLRNQKQATKTEAYGASSSYDSPVCKPKVHIYYGSPICTTPVRATRRGLNASHSESETEIIWDDNSPTAHLQRRIGENGQSEARDISEIVQCVNNQAVNAGDSQTEMPLLGLWMTRSPQCPAVDVGAPRKTQAPSVLESFKSKAGNTKKSTHKRRSGRLSLLQAELEKIASAIAMAPSHDTPPPHDAPPGQNSSPKDVGGSRVTALSRQRPACREREVVSGHVGVTSPKPASDDRLVPGQQTDSSHPKAGRLTVAAGQLNTDCVSPGPSKKGQTVACHQLNKGESATGSLICGQSSTGQSVAGLLSNNLPSCGQSNTGGLVTYKSNTVRSAIGQSDTGLSVSGQLDAGWSGGGRVGSCQLNAARTDNAQSNSCPSISSKPSTCQSFPTLTAPERSSVDSSDVMWDDDSYFEDEALLEELSQAEAMEISKQRNSDPPHDPTRKSSVKPAIAKPVLPTSQATATKLPASDPIQPIRRISKLPMKQESSGSALKTKLSGNDVGKYGGCNTRTYVPKSQMGNSKQLDVPISSGTSTACAHSATERRLVTTASEQIIDTGKGGPDQGATTNEPDWNGPDLFESSLTDEMMMALCAGMDSPLGSKVPGQESMKQESELCVPSNWPNKTGEFQEKNTSNSSGKITGQVSRVQGAKPISVTATLSLDRPDRTKEWQQSNKVNSLTKTPAHQPTVIRDHQPSKVTLPTTISDVNRQSETLEQRDRSKAWSKADTNEMRNPRAGSASGSFTFRRTGRETSGIAKRPTGNAPSTNPSPHVPVGQAIPPPVPNRQLTDVSTKPDANSKRFQAVQVPPTIRQPQFSQSAHPPHATQTSVDTRNTGASALAPSTDKQTGPSSNRVVAGKPRNGKLGISGHSEKATLSTATPVSLGGSQKVCSQLEIERKRQHAMARRQRKL